jgi:hypothetical protein
MIYALVALALVVLVWPSGKTQAKTPSPFEIPVEQKGRPQFQAALVSLSQVRSRLIATEKLGDSEKVAIECLTLSLVDGSDRE